MCAATGGPFRYTGKDMHRAHGHLHITSAEFDAVGAQIAGTLLDVGVAEREKNEVLAAINSKKAEVAGYRVGGKTGTAEKVVNGRYSSAKRFNAFLSAFPMDAPRYLVLVVLDEPQPEKPGAGATAGSNAAPTVAGIVRRIAPMLGVEPRLGDPEEAAPATAVAVAR